MPGNLLNAGGTRTQALFRTRCFAAGMGAILSLPSVRMRCGCAFFVCCRPRKRWGRILAFNRMPLRTQHRQVLIPALCAIFDQAPAAEWLKRLTAEDIPASAIQTVGEAVNDPQALARGLIVEIKHPTLDVVRSIANPVRLSSTPVVYRLPPPLLGEHNRADLAKSRILERADRRC